MNIRKFELVPGVVLNLKLDEDRDVEFDIEGSADSAFLLKYHFKPDIPFIDILFPEVEVPIELAKEIK